MNVGGWGSDSKAPHQAKKVGYQSWRAADQRAVAYQTGRLRGAFREPLRQISGGEGRGREGSIKIRSAQKTGTAYQSCDQTPTHIHTHPHTSRHTVGLRPANAQSDRPAFPRAVSTEQRAAPHPTPAACQVPAGSRRDAGVEVAPRHQALHVRVLVPVIFKRWCGGYDNRGVVSFLGLATTNGS